MIIINIKAIRVIDTMTSGRYFMSDPSDIHKIEIRNHRWMYPFLITTFIY